jgi:hypothetical protein
MLLPWISSVNVTCTMLRCTLIRVCVACSNVTLTCVHRSAPGVSTCCSSATPQPQCATPQPSQVHCCLISSCRCTKCNVHVVQGCLGMLGRLLESQHSMYAARCAWHCLHVLLPYVDDVDASSHTWQPSSLAMCEIVRARTRLVNRCWSVQLPCCAHHAGARPAAACACTGHQPAADITVLYLLTQGPSRCHSVTASFGTAWLGVDKPLRCCCAAAACHDRQLKCGTVATSQTCDCSAVQVEHAARGEAPGSTSKLQLHLMAGWLAG